MTVGSPGVDHHSEAVCRLDDLEPGRPVRIARDPGPGVVLVRIGDDVYALEDRCSHQDVRLSEGEVWEDSLEIECHRHGSTFSLVTGEALCLPATAPVPTYVARVVDGDVRIALEDR